jgi:cell division protein FtsB
VTGLVSALVGVGLLFGVGYAGYLAGRETAESRAHNTIANLRRANAALRRRVDRLEEQNYRQARQLGSAVPKPVALPEWMNP